MTLNIDGEGIETIDKSFVSKFLLPLAPLIIQDIIQRWNCISLLPIVQKVDISRRRIQTMKLSLSTQDVFGVKSSLDP
jgi:hypothetical protein